MDRPEGTGAHAWRLELALLLLVAAPLAGYLTWSMSQAGHFSFHREWALLLLVVVPLTGWVQLLLRRRRAATLRYSATSMVSRFRPGIWGRLAGLAPVMRVVALGLLALALARPQTRDRGGRVEVEGIDIMVALDLSISMGASDMAPNRLEAAKQVLDEFIQRRKSDRLGLVVFGKEAYTHCPLTLDYSALRTMLSDIQLGLIDGTATAIGNALGVSLARLRRSDAKSRVVILLTDGDNNSGNVTPQQAARYAAAMKVKVFTILMGPREGDVIAGRDLAGRPIHVRRQYPVNPKLLEEIAAKTKGKAYRATDGQVLQHNFESILDELDKTTRRDVAAVYSDAYRPFVVLALLLLGIELLLVITRFRQFP